MQSLAEIVDGSAKNVIVTGDFNSSPWDPLLAGFRDKNDLHEQPRLFPAVTRILGTFMGAGFGSPIDHVFAGNGLHVSNCRTAPAMGSDHVPLICDVAIK